MNGKSAQTLDNNEPRHYQAQMRQMAHSKGESPNHSAVVIIADGIVDLSTVYFLSKDRGSGVSITVLNKASILGAEASGKANGILGYYGFQPEAESFDNLSWKLHQ